MLNVSDDILHDLYQGVASLASTQLRLAKELECQINDLGMGLVREALEYDEHACHVSSIVRVARIPGDSLLLVTKSNSLVPPTVLERLSELLESASTVEVGDYGKVLLSDLIKDVTNGGITVEFASAEEHLIACEPNARGGELAMARLSMQLNSIIEIH